ncbi:hypothetical protein GH714_017379 [Hevea brasiliensis]|uniref:Uncharacterized protein n=1 Tax=Hevea brasiliensis TaxID=3981 RepID=A0A6A6KU32_HEVBR|nr:hypothetical protein GH714_017379 [Hevea brasiliensis]
MDLCEEACLRSAELRLTLREGAICMASDDVDLKDDNTEEEAIEAGLDESNGVDSEAGRSPLLVLASRLHTGQKVLHVVSQESTQKAWNSAQVPII